MIFIITLDISIKNQVYLLMIQENLDKKPYEINNRINKVITRFK